MNSQPLLITTKALLFHEYSTPDLNVLDKGDFNDGRDGACITVHKIVQSPEGEVLGAGRLMSESDKQAFKDFLNGEEDIKSQWLPENLMMLNSKRMVWYVPAKKRPMYFRNKDKTFSVDVWWPSLVFNFDGKSLYVAAYAGSNRPKMDQPLFHAPLFNIYAGTNLCTGTATTTKIISVNAMKIWEDAIFNTIFTHLNHDNALHNLKPNKDNKGYMRFIKAKAKAGTRFKVSEMCKLNKTLEQWVGKIKK